MLWLLTCYMSVDDYFWIHFFYICWCIKLITMFLNCLDISTFYFNQNEWLIQVNMKGCPSTGLLLIDQGVTSTGLLLINRSRCHILYSCSSSQSTRYFDHISGVMFGVLASSAIDGGFDPLSGQTKDYKFGICCFSAKHAALRSRSKDWLDRERHVYPQTVVSVS